MVKALPITPETAAVVSELGRKYLWWRPIDGVQHGLARSIAQIMNLGGYDDIRRLEASLNNEALIAVMREAQPGWFTPRSWEFWRGRLNLQDDPTIPSEPPRRAYSVAASS